MHNARNRDFKGLQDSLNDLQRRIRILEAELKDNQKGYEDKLVGQSKTILHLQGDLESLKTAISER